MVPLGRGETEGTLSVRDIPGLGDLADDILGTGWATPGHFRIGASGLLTEIRAAFGAASGGGRRVDY